LASFTSPHHESQNRPRGNPPRFNQARIRSSLRIPEDRLDDEQFLLRLKDIIRLRGVRDYSSNQNVITLRSCSIDLDKLEKAAEILRKKNLFMIVRVVRHDSHDACVPAFSPSKPVSLSYGSALRSIETTESTEFTGNRFKVPAAEPWHIREAPIPGSLRSGDWMIDLSVDRSVDHGRYSNLRHVWLLPRRLRLERTFGFERTTNQTWERAVQFLRVCRDGSITVPHSIGDQAGTISTPDDIDALRFGLCNDREWLPFNRSREVAPIGFPRYQFAQLSDKGRYALAVLEHFDSLSDAFAVLMNGYWREVLLRFGAVPAEKDPALREQLIRTLQKRLGSPQGELVFRTEPQLERLAREAIRFGRMVQNEQRFLNYDDLKDKWLELVNDSVGDKSQTAEDDEDFYRNLKNLDASIQYLCQCEVLSQGREWRCRKCLNRNWVTIDSISRSLKCNVCGREELAPVSGPWHYRASPFLLAAYREHGVEAVIWTLWELWKHASRSFYFAPSMSVWDEYPDQPDVKPTAELDALVVVDGKLCLCEAKSSASLDSQGIAKLTGIATKIRPDVLVVSCMEPGTKRFANAIQKLNENVGDDIRVQAITFDTTALERGPLLPS
ncbi:MAG: hypothetical protein P8Z76_10320, partial [Alphaproteobacteria bacterium]